MTDTEPAIDDLRQVPEMECDVVMKGGITSGVVYPYALHRIGQDYRIRNVGGASAGAIGAAAGAAAELGRASGGYDRLLAVPKELEDDGLADLFVAQRATKPLLKLMLAANDANDNSAHKADDKPKGRRVARAVGFALLVGFPFASLLGLLPGIALIVVGVTAGGAAGWLLAATGVVISLVGLVVALVLRLVRKLTVSVPQNMFGICRGNPGFTAWLGNTIDDIAGLPQDGPPLTFGQLWKGDGTPTPDGKHHIDLRMITTCISEGRPYELPWDATRFFFDPEEWRKLFPERVVKALEDAPASESRLRDLKRREQRTERWRWEERCTVTVDDIEVTLPRWERSWLRLRRRHAVTDSPPRKLCRLPDAEHLPVIVATRLSLSFPLLISAVPLYAIDWSHSTTRRSIEQYDGAVSAREDPAQGELVFTRLWFSDGGFCSNFPVHLFDAALPARPTFAINLGKVPKDQADTDPAAQRSQTGNAGPPKEPDPARNRFELAKNNRPIRPTRDKLATRGFSAAIGFCSGAFNTARNWQDGRHLEHPGYSDRIVRVLQTEKEGGINLHMDSTTIAELGKKGREAADALVRQFNEPRYRTKSDAPATGWDNHRWVRYRALLSVLPDWIESYTRGKAVFDLDANQPPSYSFNGKDERELAEQLTDVLDDLGKIMEAAGEHTRNGLKSAPYPMGSLRRIPRT